MSRIHWLARISFFCVFVSLSFGMADARRAQQTVTIKILGVNDFHGQLSQDNAVQNRPVGGAPVLAAYLRNAQRGQEKNTVITLMGDQVGASIPVSGLLDHQPSIMVLNSLANSYCSSENRMHAKCNMVAAVGNHEFDQGRQAMFDLTYGNNQPPKDQWIDLPKYPGAVFPYLAANIVDEKSGKLLFPPYVIKEVNGIPVAFIGAITKDAAGSMLPANASGLEFLDEASAINHYLPEIKNKGVNIVIAIMHQGGDSDVYSGDTRQQTRVHGDVIDIVSRLDDGVDVVMAGHTHRFLNAYLPNRNQHPVLVTQAYSYSSAFADITLKVDPKSKTVLQKSARIVTTFADVYPGNKPDAEAERIVKLAEEKVSPVVNAHVGTLQHNLSRSQNSAGESALGNLIADAFKAVSHADIGFTNSSGIRTDLKAGEVTWGQIYAVQPFGNAVIKMEFKGQDILDLLEQQWKVQHKTILQVSGLTYSYDEHKPVDYRITAVRVNGQPLEPGKVYTVAVNSYLANGGSGFTVMKRGKFIENGPKDMDVLITHIKSLPQPFTSNIDGRILSN